MQSAAGALLSAAAGDASPRPACTVDRMFEVVELDGYGTVALRSPDGSRYLQAAAGGAVHMAAADTSGQVGLRQTFLIDTVHVRLTDLRDSDATCAGARARS